jgi:TrmH family RNA methyltransferase
MKEISSPQNDQFKYWKSLTKSKGLKEGKHFLLSGKKLVAETLNDSHWKNQVEGVILQKDHDHSTTTELPSFPLFFLATVLYQELDVLGTGSPILILKQPQFTPWQKDQAPVGLELLCPFGDPQNVGALVRTAYAFGAAKVILLKEAAHPLLPKSIKASSGAVLKMPMATGPFLQDIGPEAIALDLNGTNLNSKKWPKSLRLLLGEEGQGIPAGFKGERMTLPMKNPMESLNASVAAGIAIYTLTQD